MTNETLISFTKEQLKILKTWMRPSLRGKLRYCHCDPSGSRARNASHQLRDTDSWLEELTNSASLESIKKHNYGCGCLAIEQSDAGSSQSLLAAKNFQTQPMLILGCYNCHMLCG